jgi:DNA-binding LacI/PurR family transcriptional regulator
VPQANTPRVRIQDVAALSGLSIGTVSRALRKLPNISAQAKAKVSDAAAQLGYKASPAASRLAGGSTGSVRALTGHGIAVDPDFVLDAGSSIEGGRMAMRELGLSAPENVSIIGWRRSSDESLPGPDHNCPTSGRPGRVRGQPAD